ncbi:MAG: protocatechuate 3,4-dioxygenase subunit alpha [Herpetosiphonaceae bacterium]|nr:MAG: protocatechuate 3,4-dioxygenase subunit alpha [Herpetosiphonaceae bacterium]
MTSRLPTGSQTVGPFFHDCLLREDARRNILAPPGVAGQRIRIEGCILDGDGAPVPDAMVEIWQANSYGRYNHPVDSRDLPLDPQFSGFGRSATDEEGAFWFETIKPGPVPFDKQRNQAPHICVAVFGRGLLNHLYTRIYFADDPATADDPVLALVPAERRATLLARPTEVDGSLVYRFDIILQGSAETVFFDYQELEQLR